MKNLIYLLAIALMGFVASCGAPAEKSCESEAEVVVAEEPTTEETAD